VNMVGLIFDEARDSGVVSITNARDSGSLLSIKPIIYPTDGRLAPNKLQQGSYLQVYSDK
jgi:hypothetical protein